jgi:hypothetical protein
MKNLILILAVMLVAFVAQAYPPAPASQSAVNAGTEPYLYVTPLTLAGWTGGSGGSNNVTGAQVTNIVLAVNAALQVVSNNTASANIQLGGGPDNNFVLITNIGDTYNGEIFFDKHGDIEFLGGSIAANGTTFSADNGALTTDGSGNLVVNSIMAAGANSSFKEIQLGTSGNTLQWTNGGAGSSVVNINVHADSSNGTNVNLVVGNTSFQFSATNGITGNGGGLTNISIASVVGLVTLVNSTNWISCPSIGFTNNTTSTYYQCYLTAGSSLTFKDANGNGIWAITTSLPFVVGPGTKITGSGITGSLQQLPY